MLNLKSDIRIKLEKWFLFQEWNLKTFRRFETDSAPCLISVSAADRVIDELLISSRFSVCVKISWNKEFLKRWVLPVSSSSVCLFPQKSQNSRLEKTSQQQQQTWGNFLFVVFKIKSLTAGTTFISAPTLFSPIFGLCTFFLFLVCLFFLCFLLLLVLSVIVIWSDNC